MKLSQILTLRDSRFFTGLSSPNFPMNRRNTNRARPFDPLPGKSRRILEEHLADEIEFYRFCRQRLRRQIRCV